eukprot:403354032
MSFSSHYSLNSQDDQDTSMKPPPALASKKTKKIEDFDDAESEDLETDKEELKDKVNDNQDQKSPTLKVQFKVDQSNQENKPNNNTNFQKQLTKKQTLIRQSTKFRQQPHPIEVSDNFQQPTDNKHFSQSLIDKKGIFQQKSRSRSKSGQNSNSSSPNTQNGKQSPQILSVLDVNIDVFDTFQVQQDPSEIKSTKLNESPPIKKQEIKSEEEELDLVKRRKQRRQQRKRDKNQLSKRTQNIELNTIPDEVLNTIEDLDPNVIKEEPFLEHQETIESKRDELIKDDDNLQDQKHQLEDTPQRTNNEPQIQVQESPRFKSPKRQQTLHHKFLNQNQEMDSLDQIESPRRQISHPSQLLLPQLNPRNDSKNAMSIIELTSINNELQKLLFDDVSQKSKPSNSGGRNNLENASNASGRISQNHPILRIKKTLLPRQFQQNLEEDQSMSFRSSFNDQNQTLNRTITKNLRDIQVKRKQELNDTRKSFTSFINENKILDQLKKETQDFQNVRPSVNILLNEEFISLYGTQQNSVENYSQNGAKSGLTPTSVTTPSKKKINVISKKNIQNLKQRIKEMHKHQPSISQIKNKNSKNDTIVKRSNSQKQKDEKLQNSLHSFTNLIKIKKVGKKKKLNESQYNELQKLNELNNSLVSSNILATSKEPRTQKNQYMADASIFDNNSRSSLQQKQQQQFSQTMTKFSQMKLIKQNNLFEQSQLTDFHDPKQNTNFTQTVNNKPPIASKLNKKNAQRINTNNLQSFKNLHSVYSASQLNNFTINESRDRAGSLNRNDSPMQIRSQSKQNQNQFNQTFYSTLNSNNPSQINSMANSSTGFAKMNANSQQSNFNISPGLPRIRPQTSTHSRSNSLSQRQSESQLSYNQPNKSYQNQNSQERQIYMNQRQQQQQFGLIKQQKLQNQILQKQSQQKNSVQNEHSYSRVQPFEQL